MVALIVVISPIKVKIAVVTEKPMKTIFIYGFGPFKHYRSNITQRLLEALPERPGLYKRILPVRFEPELFLQPLAELQPDYILGLGQCPRGKLLRIERKAWNLMRDKSCGLERPIHPQGPAAVPVTWRLPTRSDTRLSRDAGRYVCNFSMYVLSQAAWNRSLLYAFVHVPRGYPLQRGLNWLENLLARLAQE